MTVSKDDSVILDGAGDKKAIEERCDQVFVIPFTICVNSLLGLFFSICS